MSEKSMITAVQWIPKGFAKKNPQEYDLTEAEINQIKQDPQVQEAMDVESFSDEDHVTNFTSEVNLLRGQKIDEDYPDAFEDISDEELEDYTIKKTDALLVGAKIQGDYSSLEVYVYEEDKCNLFVHHEITLSGFPLCLEFLPINPLGGSEGGLDKGNFLIVGTFLPEIEIWNLDVLNTIEPALILGDDQVSKQKKKKKDKLQGYYGHTDAVMSLHVNPARSHILCSGSADTTVKLWDLTQKTCVQTYNHHSDKVQVARWNPTEESVLFSAGFDNTIKLFDARSNSKPQSNTLKSDVETAQWDPNSPVRIAFSCENGSVGVIDARKFESNYIMETQAHQKPCTGMSISHGIDGLMATTSLDGTVKIWDMNEDLKPIFTKDMKADKLFCANFYQDNPWLLCCGSGVGEMVLWDLAVAGQVADHFGSRANLKPHQKEENAFVGQQEEESMDEEEENGIELE